MSDEMPIEIFIAPYDNNIALCSADSKYAVSYTRTDTIAEKDAAIRELAGALKDISSVERLEFIGAPTYWMEKCIDRALEVLKTQVKAIEEAG